MILVQALGMVGMVLLLGAYWLNSAGRLRGDPKTYQLMNLAGAIALTIYSAILSAWASVALNLVWSFIALNSLRQVIRTRM